MSRFQIFPHTPTLLYLSLLFLLTLLATCNADSVSGLESLKTREIDAVVSRGGCSEKIGECFEEPEMESEISRRVLLMQNKYISYGTLRRDLVPCDKPGASYYDCNARQAHRYSRGCEVITSILLWKILDMLTEAKQTQFLCLYLNIPPPYSIDYEKLRNGRLRFAKIEAFL
ncbi:hypothetical protein OIU85_001850 [Salix viminalis]|uniref:Protein RALF-like 24 n=1 Tax=Salix viminalis TaxID=40686 RepID=A0A9Q0VPP6_SALVM|nr:hypothetical protein OIU85_001850 [Salix viminalis]